MDENEFLRFVSRIIACGNETSINMALKELKSIVGQSELSQNLNETLDGLIETSREVAELGNTKQKKNRDKNDARFTGVEISMEELGKVIREGRERIRRQREYRC